MPQAKPTNSHIGNQAQMDTQRIGSPCNSPTSCGAIGYRSHIPPPSKKVPRRIQLGGRTGSVGLVSMDGLGSMLRLRIV